MVIHERYLTTWLVLQFKFCRAPLRSRHTVEKKFNITQSLFSVTLLHALCLEFFVEAY